MLNKQTQDVGGYTPVHWARERHPELRTRGGDGGEQLVGLRLLTSRTGRGRGRGALSSDQSTGARGAARLWVPFPEPAAVTASAQESPSPSGLPGVPAPSSRRFPHPKLCPASSGPVWGEPGQHRALCSCPFPVPLLLVKPSAGLPGGTRLCQLCPGTQRGAQQTLLQQGGQKLHSPKSLEQSQNKTKKKGKKERKGAQKEHEAMQTPQVSASLSEPQP